MFLLDWPVLYSRAQNSDFYYLPIVTWMYLYLIRAIGRQFPLWYPVPHVFLIIRILLQLLPSFCTRLSGPYWLCFYELIVLMMCIFYSSNKVPPGAFGIGLGESVMVIGKPWPFCMERLVYRLPGPSGPWIQSCKHRGISITGWKSNSRQRVANHGCSGCGVISNIREMVYVVIHSRIHHDLEV